jgi:hypothetical protein
MGDRAGHHPGGVAVEPRPEIRALVVTKTFDLADEAAAWAYLAEAGPAKA